MPRIVVIRPAETDYRLQDHFVGRCDADLNEVGHAQAQAIALALAGWDFAFLAASPLKRAIATALPIGDIQDVSIHPVSGFQAMDMGEWEGKSPEQLRSEDGARFERWLTDPDFPTPGGESIREVYGRVYPEIVNIVNHAGPDETIGLVLQEAVSRALCCAALDLPLLAANRFFLDHGAFSVFERIYPGGPYLLRSWNQSAHLGETRRESWALEEEAPGV